MEAAGGGGDIAALLIQNLGKELRGVVALGDDNPKGQGDSGKLSQGNMASQVRE
jgi:hypothetical protein